MNAARAATAGARAGAEPDGSPEAPAHEPVPFKDGYRLLPGTPLPWLDSPCAPAFRAIDGRDPARALFCLVCPHPALPRLDLLPRLHARPVPGMLRLIEYGPVAWPPMRHRVLALLFEQPGGERIAATEPWTTLDTVRRLLVPVTGTLQELAARGIAHRALRPDNLFWADAAQSAVLLGECVSAPPGHDQPDIFETAENAMAEPAARRAGGIAEDIHALGITVLALTQRRRRTLAAPILDRLHQGTFAALTADEQAPPDLAALLRGMLCDDGETRWGAEDILRWTRNQRILGHRTGPPPLALRPFALGEGKFRTVRAVAAGLAAQPKPAAAAIRTGAVEQWLRSGLRDDALAERVEAVRRAMQRYGAGQRHLDESLVAQVCLTLDPAAPLRLGALAIMPEALGTALAVRAADGRPTDGFARLFGSELVGALATARLHGMPGFVVRAAELRGYLESGGLGGGIERCLYELCPGLPCLSPLVRDAHVRTLRDVVAALEQRAAEADADTAPVDAHIAGFLAAHLELRRDRIGAIFVRDGSAAGRARTELRLLAMAQAALGHPPLPQLCRWVASRMGPIVEALHSRRLRKQTVAAVGRRQESGLIGELRAALDDPELWREDDAGFRVARAEHAWNAADIERLSDPRTSGLDEAGEAGERVAAAGAVALAMAVLAVMAVVA